MSDIVQRSTEYRIKQIEIAEAKYYKTLVATLDRIEREVVSLANRDLPQTDGKLIELQAAIAIRPKIKAIVDREYLGWSDTVVREGFNKQAKSIGIGSPTFMKEVDKEIARAVVDDDEKLNQIFDEIDQKAEVGEFTQDEAEQEDQEVEQEEI